MIKIESESATRDAMLPYGKSGILKGVAFETHGLISTQFVKAADGWRVSAMAWDDERPGLELPARYRQAPP